MKKYKDKLNISFQIISPELFTEATFKLKKDVDFIYNAIFKSFLDNINLNTLPQITKKHLSNNQDISLLTIPSSDLKSEDGQKAHSLEPILILCGSFKKGSFYKSTKKYIQLSVRFDALYLLAQANFNWNVLKQNLPEKTFSLVRSELSEENLKNTIAHELSHWCDNAFHNKHLLTKSIKALQIQTQKGEKKAKDFFLGKKQHPYFTNREINAIIHEIQQQRDYYSDIQWNNFTFKDLFQLNNSLAAVLEKSLILKEKDFYEWERKIIERLYRENLLGKNMKKFVTLENFLNEQIDYNIF
jgi:hypothetical protein